MFKMVLSAIFACVTLYMTWLITPTVMMDFLSNRAWSLRASLSVKSSSCINTIGNIHYCRIEYEDGDMESPLEGSFDVLYAGYLPSRVSLVVSTRFPSHVSASFATDDVRGRFGLLVVIASTGVLSLGIGFAPWLVRMIKLYRRRNDETIVLVRVSPSERKPKSKSRHAGIQRLTKLNS